jgi:hypothetical protein
MAFMKGVSRARTGGAADAGYRTNKEPSLRTKVAAKRLSSETVR